jgi:hypothetical protein
VFQVFCHAEVSAVKPPPCSVFSTSWHPLTKIDWGLVRVVPQTVALNINLNGATSNKELKTLKLLHRPLTTAVWRGQVSSNVARLRKCSHFPTFCINSGECLETFLLSLASGICFPSGEPHSHRQSRSPRDGFAAGRGSSKGDLAAHSRPSPPYHRFLAQIWHIKLGILLVVRLK